jgi:hypothetical protein
MSNEGPREARWRVYRWRVLGMGILALVAITWLWSKPPIPQSLSYHNFADDRTLLGVPNGLNVLSNVPFVVIGLWGLWFVLHRHEGGDGPFLTRLERWPFAVFFLGVAWTGFGSASYHLDPDNDRLMWDRLPMSVVFMSLLAGTIAERIDVNLGSGLLVPLVALGVGSTLYWHWTEHQGHGDLRPYYFMQFYSLVALLLMLLLLPPRYTGTGNLYIALGWYVLAKACEHPGDAAIYAWGHWVSGHTLKHLASAAATFMILHLVHTRRPLRIATRDPRKHPSEPEA